MSENPKVKSVNNYVLANDLYKKSEPLINVDTLKDVYLTGLNITDPSNDDAPLPDATYQVYIDNAVSMLEHYLSISISPVEEYEEHLDYRVNDYAEWGYYYLSNYPVRCIRKLELTYLRAADGTDEVVQTIPNNWIRIQGHDGIMRLVPNNRFPADLQISQAGNFFPEILRSEFVPHAWKVTYDFGFETGKVPVLLNQAIAQIAAIQALVVGGNLVLGAGIAGSSISIDGLSQSIQTTQSAENSAYSATIKDYAGRLFGNSKDDPFAILTILKNFYKGREFNII